MQTSEQPVNPPARRWVAFLLAMFPLGLLVGGAFGLWLKFRNDRAAEREPLSHLAVRVDGKRVADDIAKLCFSIGERNPTSVASARGLTQAAAFLDGSLGGTNLGYTVRKTPGPQTINGSWPILTVRLAGKDGKLPALWVVSSYDSHRGSRGAEFAGSGTAASLAVAANLSGGDLRRDVVFAFVPHAADPMSPVAESMAILGGLMREGSGTDCVLCVEAMGLGRDLWVSSRDAETRVYGKVDGIGRVVGAEVLCFHDDFDLASALFGRGFSAVRVSTREPMVPGEEDAVVPSASVLSGSCGHLVELVRRLASTDG